jgi:hypothetical protein
MFVKVSGVIPYLYVPLSTRLLTERPAFGMIVKLRFAPGFTVIALLSPPFTMVIVIDDPDTVTLPPMAAAMLIA